MFGYYRVASAVNKTTVTNPRKNAEEIISLIILEQVNAAISHKVLSRFHHA